MHSISKIIIGETASRLAVNAFSSVAKGKGGNLPSDMELCDKRHDGNAPLWCSQIVDSLLDILICRPLRDLLLKELAIYIRYKQLETIDIPNLSTMLPAKSSLNQMAERMIRLPPLYTITPTLCRIYLWITRRIPTHCTYRFAISG